jgi:hypothetical protein
LLITATANGSGDVYGDVVLMIDGDGTQTWSGSLME